ncbi:HD domain-containing protein [Kitasatospora sp. NBC_01287]|uniref:HD domain-containing protein n=1 Tax=Kitasatospora sp. NBC_01287 TaxID=2903573 RepID=UPI0022512658|nr:HD domain-containing protein [Kitasatospora sp. NBC_01287]MCX4751183.1 HD domain-containing protein [Kitasatospora sp. NBC_01287]
MLVPGWAERIAEQELAASLPRRWAHSQGVARQAERLAPALGPDAALLAGAAVLHDVGYAPRLATTGFHPLDGARFLRDSHGVDDRLTRLVANHSFALLEAEERGLRPLLELEFPLSEDQVLVDSLVYCDMTTTPDGSPTTSRQRVAEIVGRYGGDSIVGRFIRRAEPLIRAAVARTEERAAAAGVQPR